MRTELVADYGKRFKIMLNRIYSQHMKDTPVCLQVGQTFWSVRSDAALNLILCATSVSLWLTIAARIHHETQRLHREK